MLEAGTNMENSSPSIATAEARANDNELSFNILSQTQENIGRQIRLRAGRVIGGSSQHNFMAAVRGSRELYDEWAALVGDQWSYSKICSLFKKMKLIEERHKALIRGEQKGLFLLGNKTYRVMGSSRL